MWNLSRNQRMFFNADDGGGNGGGGNTDPQAQQEPTTKTYSEQDYNDLMAKFQKAESERDTFKDLKDKYSTESKALKDSLKARMTDEEKAKEAMELELAEKQKLLDEVSQMKVEKERLSAEKTIAETKGKLNIDPKKFDFDKSVSELLGDNHETIGKNAETLNGLLNAVIESLQKQQVETNFNNHTNGVKSGNGSQLSEYQLHQKNKSTNQLQKEVKL